MKCRKLLAVLLASVLFLVSAAIPAVEAEGKKLDIVTTIFPVYDWIRQVSGGAEHAQVTMLLDSGVDLHSYQPTAADMMRIASCDVFVYVGGESDKWVEDALKSSVNPDQVVISLLDLLGDDVKAEELIEGMEPESHEEDEEEEADEHVWLSLRNARKLVTGIAARLAEADPDCAEAYTAGAAAYCESLDALDAQYSEVIASAAHQAVLFGDRFPFRYLVEDYGIDYYAAFSGCSAETEASFTTVAFLAAKVNELDIPVVFTIENADTSVAEMIVDNTNKKSAKIITLDSLQSVNKDDIVGGKNYIDTMRSNLEVLKEAMN
jgi:zinc transport system substrate-binding protein